MTSDTAAARQRPTIWQVLEARIARDGIAIDRPKGSRHPRFPDRVYPLDYGYIRRTTASDGDGVDVFVGSAGGQAITGLLATFDEAKADAEVKVLYDCTAAEIEQVTAWLGQMVAVTGLARAGDHPARPDDQFVTPRSGHPAAATDTAAELWDILDAGGQPTGCTVRRQTDGGDPAAGLRPGQYHRVAVVCLFNPAGQTLIQQRTADKDVGPNLWDLTGGSVLTGETSQQAAARELAEELGLTLDFTDQPPAASLTEGQSFLDFFLAGLPDTDPTSLVVQLEEVQAVRWASQAEVLTLIEQSAFWPHPPSLIGLLFDLWRQTLADQRGR